MYLFIVRHRGLLIAPNAGGYPQPQPSKPFEDAVLQLLLFQATIAVLGENAKKEAQQNLIKPALYFLSEQAVRLSGYQAKRYKQPSTQSNRSVFNDRPVMRKNSLSLDVHPLSTFAYFLYTD